MIVLDTHAVIWWSQEESNLGIGARKALEEADRIFIPSIVFWETALLTRKKGLVLKGGLSVTEWADALVSIPRIEEIPLTYALAIAADALPMHPDPADRFIAATAIRKKATLITKDRLLSELSWLDTVW